MRKTSFVCLPRLCYPIALGISAFLLFALILPAYAQNFKGKKTIEVVIVPPQGSLNTKEELWYTVEWLGIPVGNVMLKNEGIVTVRGRQCYHIVSRSFPNRFLRKLYDLEYKVHTYLDTKSLCSLRFVKIRRINKRCNYVLINFYPEQRRAIYKTWGTRLAVNFSKRKEEVIQMPTEEIPPGTQDLLSGIYYFRLLKVQSGKMYPINIYYSQSNWPIEMNVEKSFVKEMRTRGAFQAFSVGITSDLNDFILGKRKFSVDLTADARRIPLEFKFGSAMGSIRGVIKSVPE